MVAKQKNTKKTRTRLLQLGNVGFVVLLADARAQLFQVISTDPGHGTNDCVDDDLLLYSAEEHEENR